MWQEIKHRVPTRGNVDLALAYLYFGVFCRPSAEMMMSKLFRGVETRDWARISVFERSTI